MENISTKIKELKNRLNMTSTELSSKSGLSLTHISKLESRNIESISLVTAKKLSDGFGMTLKDFLDYISETDKEEDNPSLKIITNALRGSVYTKKQIDSIIEFAKYVKESKN